MAQAMLHRAGVAVLLIATLLLPYGRCQSPTRNAGHDCCAHPSAPIASVKASCCTVRSQLPAIVGQRAILTPHPLLPAAFAGSPAETAISFDVAPKTPAPLHPSPPGPSVLRI